jgi:hypothetical protein
MNLFFILKNYVGVGVGVVVVDGDLVRDCGQ